MDYRKKYLNRTGFQRAGLATLPRTKRVKPGYDQEFTLQKGVSAAPIKQSTVLEEILGGGILGTGASKFLEDEDKENLPVETEETKLPKKEPPEGEPDLLPELTKQTVEEVIRKEIKEKNKITTWEDHFPTIEEATKAAEDAGGTLKEFEEGVIQKKITFKKLGNIGGQFFEVLYNGKEIAELAPLEETYKGLKEYRIKLIGDMDTVDTVTGLAEAKESVKKYITDGLLDKSEPSPALNYWQTLRKTFEEAVYDKKGDYIYHPDKEEYLEYQKSLKLRPKKAHGGLIDKPLTGGSRYI